MQHFYENPSFGENWFNYKDLYSEQVNKSNDDSHFVEVGSWKGKSSVFMAVEIINSKKNIKFDCVDTWSGSLDTDEIKTTKEYQENPLILNDKLYQIFLDNINPVSHIINPIRSSSVEASKLYKDNSLDFVFIDACHTYKCVEEDIKSWLPKVKNSGVLAGHDVFHQPVEQAVKNNLHRYKIIGECWYYQK